MSSVDRQREPLLVDQHTLEDKQHRATSATTVLEVLPEGTSLPTVLEAFAGQPPPPANEDVKSPPLPPVYDTTQRLVPATPHRSKRYDKLSIDDYPVAVDIPTPFSVSTVPIAPIPEGWLEYIHPEEQFYFYNPARRICTAANLRVVNNLQRVIQAAELIDSLIAQLDRTRPNSTELVLEIGANDADGGVCRYYLLDHARRTIFWLDDATERLDLPPVAPMTHLDYLLLQHYLTHVEYFPMHHTLPVSVEEEPITLLSSASAASVISNLSTVPFDQRQCEASPRIITKPPDSQGVDGFRNPVVAWLWSKIAGNYFDNLHGEPNGRLSLTQRLLPKPQVKSSGAIHPMKKAPKHYCEMLSLLWVDKIAFGFHWRTYKALSLKDWMSLWAFVLIMTSLGIFCMSLTVTAPSAFVVSLGQSVSLLAVLLCFIRWSSSFAVLRAYYRWAHTVYVHASEAVGFIKTTPRPKKECASVSYNPHIITGGVPARLPPLSQGSSTASCSHEAQRSPIINVSDISESLTDLRKLVSVLTVFERLKWRAFHGDEPLDSAQLLEDYRRELFSLTPVHPNFQSFSNDLDLLNTLRLMRRTLNDSDIPPIFSSDPLEVPNLTPTLPSIEMQSMGAKIIVILIGINQYPALGLLNGCVKDVEAIHDWLTIDQAVPTDHITRLVDKDATRTAILDTLYGLRDNPTIGSEYNIVITYCGHGTTYEADSDETFTTRAGRCGSIEAMCPADRGALDESGNVIQDISSRELNIILSEIAWKRTRNILVIMDCCFAGGSTRGDGTSIVLPGRPALAPLPSLGAMLQAADADPRRVSPMRALSETWIPDLSSHVTLAACLKHERSHEILSKTAPRHARGLFVTRLLSVFRSEEAKTASFEDIIGLVGSLDTRKFQQTPTATGERSTSRLWFTE